MEQSANLQLPYIMPSQAQKHVTHNEAIRSLDALVHLAVLDRDLSAPPASPVDGARYLVAAGATHAWAGKEGRVAAWQDGAWAFPTPKSGWIAWVVDEDRLISFDGVGWVDAAVHSVNPAPMVGVNATADAGNRLAVKSPATLFDEETGDHRLKINKASAGDTASLVFQSGYSGRAEFGLAGDDDWHVKVSADGAAWTEALKVDRATGRVHLPAALPLNDDNQVVTRRHVREKLNANRTYYVRTDGSDSNDGLANTSGGAFLTLSAAYTAALALDLAGFTLTVQIADGTYGALGITASIVGGNITFNGNNSTPANVVISGAGNAVSVQSAGNFTFSNMTFTGSFKGVNVVHPAAKVSLSNVRFDGSASNSNLYVEYGVIELTGAVEIAASCYRAFSAVVQGTIRASGITITYTGTPAWGGAGFYFNSMGMIYFFSVTLSGSATGKRYEGAVNAAMNTFGAGTSSTYFPGNSDGTVTTGAQQT